MSSQLNTNKLPLEPNKNLTAFNTLSVPSVCRYFCEITSDKQFDLLYEYVKKEALPLLILGGGSNVILPEFIDAVVVKISTKSREVLKETDDHVLIRCAAGEDWHSLVMWSVAEGYYGLENLALIPGSVGAAPIQNIGAYGVEFDACCESVEVIHLDTFKRSKLSKEECQFDYRESIFKQALINKVIISHVVLRLKKTPEVTIGYPVLKQALSSNVNSQKKLTSLEVANAVIAIRQSKLPDPKLIPNAGSFFKNPIVTNEKLALLKQKFPAIVAYAVDQHSSKLAAAWLIEHAGWKGKIVDELSMHSEQALVLTNPALASSKRLLNFADKIVASIRHRFGVNLEIEPRVVN